VPGTPSKKRKNLRSKPARSARSTKRHRILTTHVGSLIRPPEPQQFLKVQRDKQPYDEAAFENLPA
jgi:hypothetical protein